MNIENTTKLFDRFKFFHPEKSPLQGLMCFGFCCSDGWFDLIWELCEKIEPLAGEDFEVIQVKEKFGTLRFYTFCGSAEIEEVIEEYEFRSGETCEICGDTETADLCGGGWYRTLCDDCMGRTSKERFPRTMVCPECNEKVRSLRSKPDDLEGMLCYPCYKRLRDNDDQMS